MATAFTGTLGWTGIHPVLLGGPPLTNTYGRSIPTRATPFIGHIYQNDGVTFLASFPILNRPSLTVDTANGGFGQVELEVSGVTSGGSLYGQATYGISLYGVGAAVTITQGNVVRLTEQGGDGQIVYSGIVEDLPDIATPSKTTHKILLSPFGFELDDVQSNSFYSGPVDVSQIVRDAVRQTFHCSCDQVSVPPSIGIQAPLTTQGTIDFRNQTTKNQIDTARSIAGPTWFWFVDELGRVWFQSMGSMASYTLMRGQHYEDRTSAASIQDRKNRVVVVGGVPAGGSANVVGRYDGASQSTLGIRALQPDLLAPHITDQFSVSAMALSIGLVLDRIWNRVNLKVHPPFAQRVHGSQPGGAMLRYWEPAVNPMNESETGSGTYTGPFIVQHVENDGIHQTVTAGDIPVTSQTDVQNMTNQNVVLWVGSKIMFADATLTTPQQVVTGSFQSAPNQTGFSSLSSPSRWVTDQSGIRLYDGTAQNYGAPSGNGVIVELAASGAVFICGSGQGGSNSSLIEIIDPNDVPRVQMGNLGALGASTAGWKFRAVDASNSPVFDSDQVFGDRVMKNLGIASAGTQSFTSTTFATVTGSGLTFSLTRTANIYAPFLATGRVNTNNGNVGFVRANLVGVTTSGNENFGVLANFAQTSSGWIFVTGLTAGSYTLQLDAAVNNTPQTFDVFAGVVQCFQVGG